MKHHNEVHIILNTMKKQSKKLNGNLNTRIPQTGPQLAQPHTDIHSQLGVNRLKQIEEGAVIESEERLTFVQLNREAKLPTIFC